MKLLRVAILYAAVCCALLASPVAASPRHASGPVGVCRLLGIVFVGRENANDPDLRIDVYRCNGGRIVEKTVEVW